MQLYQVKSNEKFVFSDSKSNTIYMLLRRGGTSFKSAFVEYCNCSSGVIYRSVTLNKNVQIKN